jgi:hypothetical protein
MRSIDREWKQDSRRDCGRRSKNLQRQSRISPLSCLFLFLILRRSRRGQLELERQLQEQKQREDEEEAAFILDTTGDQSLTQDYIAFPRVDSNSDDDSSSSELGESEL